jgi:hypothetical protein
MSLTTAMSMCVGARHKHEAPQLRMCLKVDGAGYCSGCLRLIAGLLDAEASDFRATVQDAIAAAESVLTRDETAEMMDNTGHEDQR